ncbi:MAG: N,N-dimethylformamidase beta subunit family domain-containing protein [Pseudomonadota bacterium]
MYKKTITGYCSPICVEPGQCIDFKVSVEEPGPYHVQIVRMLCGDDRAAESGLRETELDADVNRDFPARSQPTFPGSCAVIAPRPVLESLGSFSIGALIYPTRPGFVRQVIVSHWSDAGGFELAITAEGWIEWRLSNGEAVSVATAEHRVPIRRWLEVIGVYNQTDRTSTLKIRQLSVAPGDDANRPDDIEVTIGGVAVALANDQPICFGARWLPDAPPRAHGEAHFNGKIERPRLINRVVSPSEHAELFAYEVPHALRDDVVGWWDFARDIDSEAISDRSGNNLNGHTAQLPARAVTGHNWTGQETNWRHAPEQYGAIYFHDDDLIDAQWDTDFTFTVPMTWASGIYSARIRQGAAEVDEYITFFVRPPRGSATARALFLVPTASYLAYSNSRLHLRPSKLFGGGEPEYVNDAQLSRHPEFGGSLYDVHSDRSGVQFASYHRPVQNLKAAGNRPWCFPADTNLIDWLDRKDIDFDVLTDEELHREGVAALSPYSVVLTGSHPEYYSTEMLDGVDAYLRRGGRLMYLGGNGFYWRIAFHPSRTGTIEVRRAEDGTRAWIAEPGEYFHAFNGEYGGLWRRIGRAPNQLVGIGFAAQGFDTSGYYRKGPDADHPKAAFVFAGVPESVIGDFGSIGGGAAGEEIDRYDAFLGSPSSALVLASSENHDASMLRTKEEFLSTVPPFDDPKIRADMVLFETPRGGAVFSTGSITWIASLSHNDFNNNVSRVTENVLRRFLDPAPL